MQVRTQIYNLTYMKSSFSSKKYSKRRRRKRDEVIWSRINRLSLSTLLGCCCANRLMGTKKRTGKPIDRLKNERTKRAKRRQKKGKRFKPIASARAIGYIAPLGSSLSRDSIYLYMKRKRVQAVQHYKRVEKTWQELETAKAQIDYIAHGLVGISLTLVNDIDSTSNTKKCRLICNYINIYSLYHRKYIVIMDVSQLLWQRIFSYMYHRRNESVLHRPRNYCLFSIFRRSRLSCSPRCINEMMKTAQTVMQTYTESVQRYNSTAASAYNILFTARCICHSKMNGGTLYRLHYYIGETLSRLSSYRALFDLEIHLICYIGMYIYVFKLGKTFFVRLLIRNSCELCYIIDRFFQLRQKK